MRIKNKLVNLIKYRGITFPKSIYDPSEIDWPVNWNALHYKDIPKITRELNREICKQHVLYNIPACALGRKSDSDDFLFQIDKDHQKFAWVHLTWNMESDPAWPNTQLYSKLEDWMSDVNDETNY